MSAIPPGDPAASSHDDEPEAAPGPDAPAPGAPTWAALARVWAGEAPAPDDAEARRWLADRPDEARQLDALSALVDRAYPAPADTRPVDVEAALARVTARRDAPALQVVRAEPPGRRSASRPAVGRPAARRHWPPAALVAAAAAAVAVVLVRRPGDTPAGGAPQAATPRRFATAVGRPDSLRLPDGTRVVLGPASTLAYGADYGATTRTVALEGEAYFHVPHDSTRPFVVTAGNAAVHDLGTAFAVRQDPDGRVAVTVTEGAVRLTPATSAPATAQPPRPAGRPAPARDTGLAGIVLRAGERGTVAPLPGRAGGIPAFAATRLAPQPDPGADAAWAGGRLVFRDAALPEVAGALRRWYGVELRAADPAVAGRHLTATFRGDPLPNVLRVVGLALGARVDQRGDTVFLRGPR